MSNCSLNSQECYNYAIGKMSYQPHFHTKEFEMALYNNFNKQQSFQGYLQTYPQIHVHNPNITSSSSYAPQGVQYDSNGCHVLRAPLPGQGITYVPYNPNPINPNRPGIHVYIPLRPPRIQWF